MTIVPALKRRLLRERGVIFLDFDGTLAPITSLPENAKLSGKTKALIEKLAASHTVIVVSGRGLSDIKNRVPIKGVHYAGNHGFEWHVGARQGHIKLTPRTIRDLEEVRGILKQIARTFPGAILEDKAYTLSLHYRLVSPTRTSILLDLVQERLGPYLKTGRIRLMRGKKVLEVRPSVVWHKGDFARMILRRFRSRPHTVIFCGDDTTDEDAFRALAHDITVKVGPGRDTAARFYLPKRSDIDSLFAALTS